MYMRGCLYKSPGGSGGSLLQHFRDGVHYAKAAGFIGQTTLEAMMTSSSYPGICQGSGVT